MNEFQPNEPFFDLTIKSPHGAITSAPTNLREIIFGTFPHREEDSNVIYGHIGERFISIDLPALRYIAGVLSIRLQDRGLVAGDTIMLASFSSSNELANALPSLPR
jgi:hypothetical protein